MIFNHTETTPTQTSDPAAVTETCAHAWCGSASRKPLSCATAVTSLWNGALQGIGPAVSFGHGLLWWHPRSWNHCSLGGIHLESIYIYIHIYIYIYESIEFYDTWNTNLQKEMRNILSKKAYTLIPSQSGSRLWWFWGQDASSNMPLAGCQGWAFQVRAMRLSTCFIWGKRAVTFHTFHQPLLSPWVRDIFGEPNLTHLTCCGIHRLELLAGVHLSAAELGKLLREQRINLDYMSCGPQWLCPWNPCATTANPETESGWYSSWGYYQLSGLAWMIPLPQSKKPFPSVIIHTFQDWT